MGHTEELKQIQVQKEHLDDRISEQRNKEEHISFLLKKKERLFMQMFDTWRNGEMRMSLHKAYSEVKAAEKRTEYELSEINEALNKKMNELEMKEDTLRSERLKIARQGVNK